MKILMMLGIALVIFGIADTGLSFAQIDLWYDWLGIQLPADIWEYSGMIAIGIGYVLVKIGTSGNKPQAETEEA